MNNKVCFYISISSLILTCDHGRLFGAQSYLLRERSRDNFRVRNRRHGRRYTMSAKSAFVSTAGVFLSLMEGIITAVKEAGGNEADVYEAANSREILKKIAGLIVGNVRQTFKVTVDYSKSLAEMIKAGHYDWVNNVIVADHFPVQGKGQSEAEVALFHFNRNISSDDAIAEMAIAGYRPARIEELLALGASQPEFQKEFPIVALGSAWQDPGGHRHVPCLRWNGAKRYLNLGWFEGDWSGRYRFAAVRKS